MNRDNNIITLFERQSVPYQLLGFNANDPIVNTLDQLNQKIGTEVIQLGRKEIRATQYVGVIQAGEFLFQILPKIDSNPNGNAESPYLSEEFDLAATSAAQNFLYLLAHVNQIKLQNQTISTLRTRRGNWWDLLTRLFVVELMTQLQQGFHQDYVCREELLPYLRGHWNIIRQFARRPNLADGLDISFDDYLPDTTLNRVFRLAVHRMLQITRDLYNRQLLADLENWLQPVQLITHLGAIDLDRIEFTRLNERFFPAFKIARLLLEGLTVQLLAGGQRAFALVFDMDFLFEKFVATIMQTYSRRIFPEPWLNLSVEFQGGMRSKYLVQPKNQTEKPLFHLKPDIILGSLALTKLIIDTKNKVLPLYVPYRGVAEDDAYQMLAYALQFKCSQVLLLYPRKSCTIDIPPQILSVDQTNIQYFVATLNLHQPMDQLDQFIREIRIIMDFVYSHSELPQEVLWPM